MVVLLLVGGLVHLIPGLYTWLAQLTGGTPWVQIVVGAVSVIAALLHMVGACKKCKGSSCGSGSCCMHAGEKK